jgi:hypothetical protein
MASQLALPALREAKIASSKRTGTDNRAGQSSEWISIRNVPKIHPCYMKFRGEAAPKNETPPKSPKKACASRRAYLFLADT